MVKIFFTEADFNDWNEIINRINDNDVKLIKNIPNDINNIIVIPLSFKIIEYILSKNLKSENILCPNKYEIIEILNNKIKFYFFMIENNFSNLIPKMYVINNKLINKIEWPAIYKLPKAYGGKESFICFNENDLKKKNKDKEYFLQEYIINKEEHSANLFIINGSIVWSVCYKIKNNLDYYIQKGKMSNYEKVTLSLEVFEPIFIKLNYIGPVCIDFKLNNNNEIKIFEINPRFGGTFIHSKDFIELINFIKEYFIDK